MAVKQFFKREMVMSFYMIYPIVMGANGFNKAMMTCQHDYGTPCTIG
jgi:hypothetical protein